MENPNGTTGPLFARQRLTGIVEASAGAVLMGALTLVVWNLSGSWWVCALAIVLLAGLAGLRADRRAAHRESMVQGIGETAAEIRRGGTLHRLDEARFEGFGVLASSFNDIFDSLGEVAHRVLRIVDRVRGLPQGIEAAMSEIEQSADRQEEAVEETASLLANINSSIKGINERVEKLSNAADDSSSSILEMGSSIDEVARNMASLHETVESSTSSVHEMGASIRQVAQASEKVGRIAEETATSMVQMDRAVQEVGRHVGEASNLTERVSDGAEQGAEAVTETIRDIERIHHLTRDSKSGLETLVARVSEVGSILDVIGDINDETNLLSLNAAIIAAQAGEQGKAFLVVANHVKTLAQRTAASTKDISQLIAAIESESDAAVAAMGAGIEAIEQGVGRSRVAGESLQSIREQARDASERVAEIARTAEEQTRTSGLVARASQETSTQVQQITSAMAEQSKVAEQMLANSEAALHACRHVHRSTDEQRETGRYITDSISSITEMIRLILENTAVHARSSEAVSQAVGKLLDNAQRAGQRVPLVKSMLEELNENAAEIVHELARFEAAAAEGGSRHSE